jgi:hypothetical protein
LLFTHFCFTQNNNLSKQQMQTDIAFLVNAIKEIDPNLPIRQAVTSTNLYQELDSLADLSENINSFEEFYLLANKILQITQDQHNQFTTYPSGIEENNFYITNVSNKLTGSADEKYGMYVPCCGGIICVQYINGKYFTFENLYTKQELPNNDTLLIPAGAEILAINNIPIKDYVNESRKIDNAIRWSSNNRSYYARCLYHPFFLTGKFENATATFSFDGNEKTVNLVRLYVTGNVTTDYHTFSVQYFDNDKMLYIRIPKMDYQKIDTLKSEVLKHKNTKINKVVVDIRNNGGGNDLVWESVLASIINKPIIAESKVYYKNTSIVRDYIINIRKEKIRKIFKLGDIEYFTTEKNENNVIKSFKKSLNYDGKIYILVNEGIFSSSLAFVSVCKQSERLVTVGTPTGFMCGRSATPFFLSLPNSKLIFELVPCIDMSNNKTKPEDYYDFQAEIPVNLDVDFYVKEMSYKGKRYDKDFLYNHDPVFQKVLELE